MDLRVNLSSCVPATAFETAGASLGIADLMPFADHSKVIGLAEFMNFPGVLAADPDVLAKLAAFQGRHMDGHAPLLRGPALNGYLAAGIRTDHEATTAEEAREKLAKGMVILIREGSVSKDLAALAEVLDADTSPVMALCTDDRNPLDIAEEGHIDGLIRHADRQGPPAPPRLPSASGELVGRPGVRAARPGARRARLAGRPRGCSTILRPAPSLTWSAPGGWSMRRCSPHAGPSRRRATARSRRPP